MLSSQNTCQPCWFKAGGAYVFPFFRPQIRASGGMRLQVLVRTAGGYTLRGRLGPAASARSKIWVRYGRLQRTPLVECWARTRTRSRSSCAPALHRPPTSDPRTRSCCGPQLSTLATRRVCAARRPARRLMPVQGFSPCGPADRCAGMAVSQAPACVPACRGNAFARAFLPPFGCRRWCLPPVKPDAAASFALHDT